GYANIAIGQDVFRSFIADPISQGNGNIAIGEQAMNKTLTGFQNVAIGRQAMKGNLTGSENIAIGRAAGYNNFGEPDNILTNYNQGIYIGTHATPKDTFSTNEVVIGYNTVGNGSNTATLGNNSITATYLKGTTNLRGYGLGNKEATDLTKTRSGYIAAFATDGTLLELDTTGLYASGATTLSGLTDVTLTNPQINDVLKYNGTAWVNDTLTISGGGGVLSVTANNGLTNTGTASQPVIELGGTLSKATTTISANFKNLVINRPLNFEVDSVYLARIGTQDGLSTSSKLQIGAAANSWQSVNNDDDLTNRIELYSSLPTQGAKISSYQNSNNGIFTQIQLLPQEMKVVTPGVNSGTATAGQVLKLVNPSTGEVEFASDSTGSATLSGLTDVSISTPAAGEVLIYNGTAWVNDTVGVSGGGFALPTDSITFNDNTGDAVAQKLQYNSEYGTLVFGAGNDTPVHIGSDLGWYVKNQTGANIAKGVPVYASGTDGASGRITIAPMIANNSVPAKFFLGV
ncbi:MAG TPA: hypothetical protein VLA40_10865, partial [Rheinheimera sp.]|nr:hypothetical protein [Rheinheimera sp.]